MRSEEQEPGATEREADLAWGQEASLRSRQVGGISWGRWEGMGAPGVQGLGVCWGGREEWEEVSSRGQTLVGGGTARGPRSLSHGCGSYRSCHTDGEKARQAFSVTAASGLSVARTQPLREHPGSQGRGPLPPECPVSTAQSSDSQKLPATG